MGVDGTTLNSFLLFEMRVKRKSCGQVPLPSMCVWGEVAGLFFGGGGRRRRIFPICKKNANA